MRNLKKVLALAVASVMLMGMMVVGTSAASFADVADTDNVEAIEVMNMIGVMIGDGEKFNPNKGVTRNEMAVIMTNLLDLDTDAYTGTSPFTDVPAWAEPFVAACYANGIVTGTSATTFGGDGGVTATQAALMVMKALGYFQYASDFGADWQLATVKQADKIDLFEDIDAKVTATLTRNEAAQLVLNALQATMVEADDNGIGVNTEGTLVSKYTYVDVRSAAAYADEFGDTIGSDSKYAVALGEKLFNGDLDKVGGDADDFDRPGSHKWTYKNEAVNVTKAPKYTFVVDKAPASSFANATAMNTFINEALDITAAADKLVYGTGTDYTYVNGAVAGNFAAATFQLGDVVEIYMNGTSKTDIDTVVVVRESVAQIVDVKANTGKATVNIDGEDVVYAYNIYIDTTADGNLDGAHDVIATELTLDGYTTDYVKDAYLKVCLEGGTIHTSALAEVKTGAITKFTATADATMGGTKYKMANASIIGNSLGVTFKAEDNYDLVLNTAGNIIAVIRTAGADATLEDVVYTNGNTWSETETKYNKTTIKYYTQVIGMDGVITDILVGGVERTGTSPSYTYTNNYGIVASDGTTLTPIAEGLKMIADVDATDNTPAYKSVATTTCSVTDHTFGTISNAAAVTFKATDKKEGSYYLTADTTYIQVKGDAATTKTAVTKGGINYVTTAAPDPAAEKMFVVYKTVNGSSEAVAIVIAGSTMIATNADVLYIESATTTATANGYAQTAYDMAGNKLDITVGNATDAAYTGFVTYKVDEKGVYDLATTGDTTVADKAWDKDEETVTSVAVIDSYYADCITLVDGNSPAHSLVDIPAKDLIVVDLRDTDAEKDGYKAAITSLADIQLALDTFVPNSTSVYFQVVGSAYVTETGAVIFFVNNTVDITTP